jgi:hypothetical protein
MKDIAKAILLNVFLFVVFFGSYTIISFWAGLGSNDYYVLQAWILFIGFVILHFTVFTYLTKRTMGLRSKYFLTGIASIIAAYVLVLSYYASGS